MIRTRRLAALTLAGLFALLALGCAGTNIVSLKYDPVSLTDTTCVRSVAVVRFTDAVPGAALGSREGKTTLFPSMDPGLWVAQALKVQLDKAGCRAQFHDAAAEFFTDYAILGEVRKVSVNQTSGNSCKAELKIMVFVQKAGETVFQKEYSGSAERTYALPSDDNAGKILKELLQDFMTNMTPDLVQAMK